MGTAVAPGIGIFDEVRWGAHLCQLYESDQDLIEVLVPYFGKGLERNALCLWLSSAPLGQEVMEALRRGIPNFDQYQRRGQIEAIPHTEWYLRDGQLSVSAAIERASGALNQAKLWGFEGIWVAGDLSWVDKREWQTLVTYEETVGNSISDAPAVALCARSVSGLSILEALDLFKVHRAIIMKRQGRWNVVENLEQQKVEQALRETERSYKHLFDTTLDGIEVIDAATGRILMANPAVARVFGFASPEQMVGIDPLAYIPTEDRERVAGLMAEAMFEKDLHRVMELKALRTDGSEIWISAIGVRTQYQGRLAGLVSIRDITEQRKAEKALQESQRELQAVFDSVRDGIVLFDLTGRLMAVNKRVLEVGGYTADELAGRSFDQLDMFGPQDIAKMVSIFAPVLSGDEAPLLELEVVTKSGQRLMLDVRVTPLKRDNDVIGAIAVLRDTTERKRAVELLQVSEQRNRLLVENANEGIVVSQDGLVKFANQKTLEMMESLGYTEDEVHSRPFAEFIHPEDRQRVLEANERRLTGGASDHVYQFRAVGKNGETKWIELNAAYLPWEGKPGVLVFLNDVTERRQAEAELRESEGRYRLVAESVSDTIWTMDMNLRFTYVSASVTHMLGYSVEEMLLKNMGEVVAHDSLEVAAKEIEATLAEGETAERGLWSEKPVELKMIRKDGATIWTESRAILMRGVGGQSAQILGVTRDISERKAADDELRSKEAYFRALIEKTTDGIAILGTDGRIRYTSPSCDRMFGFPSGEQIGNSVADLLHPDDISLANESLVRLLENPDVTIRVEARGRHKDGAWRVLEATGTNLLHDAAVQGIVVNLRDITERKLAERVLQESENKYRLLAENAQDVIIAMDMNLRPTYVSPSIERLTGYNVEEATARSLEEALTAASLETAIRAFADGLSQVEKSASAARKLEMMIELELRCKDGSTVWAEFALSFMCDANGRPSGVLAVIRDVDERRRSQQALSESEKRYRLLAENVSDVIWVTDVNLRPTYVSPSIERLLGYSAGESLSRGLEEALSPLSAERVRDIAAKLMAADRDGEESAELQHPVEIELRGRDGSSVWVDTTVTIIRDAGGHPVQFLGVLRNVTERKQAEEQVRQSCQKLEKTLEGTIQAIRAMVDTRDRYTAGHQQRVTELACAIGEAMGLPSKQIESIHIAGLLHDVGKIVLPTEILTKPGRLNEIEFAMIRTHSKAGYNILKSIEFPWPVAKMVLQHHERVNGTGYPDGVRGEEILLEARILAVADVVEAMSSHRPYRAALGLDEALGEITKNSGVLYDPRVVDTCVRVFREGGFSFKAEATTDLY